MNQDKVAEKSPAVLSDEWLDSFRAFDNPKAHRVKRKHLELLGLLDVKPDGMVVLDAGCGVGAYSVILAENGFKVVGVDIATLAIKKAKELAVQRGLSFYPTEGDLESLPFDDNTFDVVFGGWVLHHFPSLDKVCAELCRVLKPRGIIAIVEPNESNLAMRFSRFVEDLFHSAIIKAGLDTPNRTVHKYGDYLREFKKVGIMDLEYSSCHTDLPLLLDIHNVAVSVLLRLVVKLRSWLFGLSAMVLPRPLNGQDLLIKGVKEG